MSTAPDVGDFQLFSLSELGVLGEDTTFSTPLREHQNHAARVHLKPRNKFDDMMAMVAATGPLSKDVRRVKLTAFSSGCRAHSTD